MKPIAWIVRNSTFEIHPAISRFNTRTISSPRFSIPMHLQVYLRCESIKFLSSKLKERHCGPQRTEFSNPMQMNPGRCTFLARKRLWSMLTGIMWHTRTSETHGHRTPGIIVLINDLLIELEVCTHIICVSTSQTLKETPSTIYSTPPPSHPEQQPVRKGTVCLLQMQGSGQASSYNSSNWLHDGESRIDGLITSAVNF